MVRSRNIYLVGPMGAGKSTIGRELAKKLKMTFYDSDDYIEDTCGVEIAWIFDVEGEGGFLKREEGAIHDLTEKQGIVLATGGGTVVSEKNRTRLAGRGAVVYLKVTIEQQLERTEKDKKRPLLQVEKSKKPEVIAALRKEREPLYEQLADFVMPTEGKSVRSIVAEIVDFIDSSQEL